MNRELMAVKAELQRKVDELEKATSDISNLLTGTNIAALFLAPIEGRLLYGAEGVDVGRRLKVQLVHTDVERGYIDFKKIQ